MYTNNSVEPAVTPSEESTFSPSSLPYSPTAVTDVDHSVVKCKYLNEVITHMMVMADKFNEMKNWSSLIEEIRGYNVSKSIISLYKRDPILIGSLWDFYLYKIWLEKANIHLLKDDITQTKVKTTHGNVINSLENDLQKYNCPKDNKNSLYGKWIEPTAANIKSMVKRNHSTFYSPVKIIDVLEPETLFMETLDPGNKRLLEGHTRFVDLGTHVATSLTFQRSWESIWSEFDVTVDHYKKIKSYFTLHKNFLNTIMIKCYWEQYLHIEKISDKKQKLSYATKLITLLNDYNQMLVIQDDSNLKYLLNTIEEIANKNGDTTKTTFELMTKIESMCSLLECSEIDTLSIYVNETIYELSFKSFELYNVDPLYNVKDFLDILRDIFKDMRLDVTRTFLSHIDDKLSTPDDCLM